jgi:NitT/TauT family transport system permease protein/taurine transport system permease protein
MHDLFCGGNRSVALSFRALTKKFYAPLLRYLAGVCVLLAIWQIIAVSVLLVRDVPFPGPLQTFSRLGELLAGAGLANQPFLRHLGHSLGRWLSGVGIAASLGLTHGLLAARWPLFDAATSLVPRLFLFVPGLAWVPVAILLFGVSEASTVFMIAAAAFGPMAVAVSAGIRSVDAGLARAGRMLGAEGTVLFCTVLVPAALPQIISGLRLGCGTGWRVLVAAEMVVGTGTGLGYAIIQSRWSLDYRSAFACVAVICLVGFAVDRLVLGRIEAATVRRWSLAAEVR